ncbi:MAG: hypothetical protein BGP16_14145 [Sphingobium sp. 66-54]|nr:MAG: hypothetical protein BGP16_14145 [Sphingobium sp. 66-54]
MPARLFKEHREINEAADTLLAMVRRTPRPSMEAVSQLRARIGSLTLSHLRNEAMLVISPLLASGRIDELPEGRQVLSEIHELRAAYSNHIRDWTPQTITSDWAGYTRAVAELTALLKIMFAREEEHLHMPAIKLLYPEAVAEAMRATG